jgi:hypothetical protein
MVALAIAARLVVQGVAVEETVGEREVRGRVDGPDGGELRILAEVQAERR